ncbi:microtubule cross-linking factor 1-like [Asparagus officinalis]|uniref:microtubule cross-linking factor 1-like n=1 Tax=Asparagus officinalis TaxID=4686 RepID=UPI00098E097E|nr:microtubule cross-linking factor 1-like [Asparagus officinalis]
MGTPLLSPSSSLLSKRQRETVAESSRVEAAKKARRDETVETARATEGQDNVPQVNIPGAATPGSGAVLPTSSAASGAVPATSKDAPPQSGVRPQTGVLAASVSASGGAVEKVISIPSDEEEEAGDEEGPTGSADPAHEVAGKEDPPSWASRSSGETGESEEDDDISVHEALSSEEEVLAREDAPGQIEGSPAPAAASAGDRPSARESLFQREASTPQVTTSLSAAAVDAVTAAPRASLVTPALAAPIPTSTVMTTGTSTVISSTVEEAALSPLERERKRSAARSVADFQDTLAGCIKLALEESCPFENFEEDLDYIVCFLIKRLGHTAAKPYFQRKEEVKEAVQQLLALRAKSSTLVDLASGEVRAAEEERDRRLNETMSLEARLSAELEQAKAEDERVALEQQKADNRVSRLSSEVENLKQVIAKKADNRVSRLSSEVENLKQVIAKVQASLAIQEKAREQAAKELESIGSRRILTANSAEEKDRAHREVKETVRDLASRTEEDLRQEILRRLELRHAREIREAELRLKTL